jgi:hypothetical protein
MLGLGESADFDRDVRIEIQYLETLHGAEALNVATVLAARPHLRTWRRKVLKATVRELQRQARTTRAGLFNWLLS